MGSEPRFLAFRAGLGGMIIDPCAGSGGRDLDINVLRNRNLDGAMAIAVLGM